MMPPSFQEHPLPAFRQPSEAVVFWALENLCEGAGGRFMLPLPKLARHCGLSVSTTNRAVLSLAKRGAIHYRRGFNQSQPSIFEIPSRYPRDPSTQDDRGRGEQLSAETTARPKIGIPNPSDSDSIIKDLYKGDKSDIGGGIPKQNEDSATEAQHRLAHQVAEGLNDLKNLALYRSYCRRFPTDLILKAYVRAREPTPDKIRKSRGALFNFLVQLYAKRRNLNDDPGPSSR